MIYSGDSSIADAKFGSQQLAKIYRGSALVWENNEWVEYTFPNTTRGTSVKCTSVTGDGALGFTFAAGTGTDAHALRCYHMFDDSAWSMQKRNDLGNNDTSGIYVYAVFPSQWEEIQMKSVSVTNLNSNNFRSFRLDSTYDRAKVMDSNGNIIISKTAAGGLETNILAGDYHIGNSAQRTLNSVNAVAIRMFSVVRSSSTGEMFGGNYTLTFMIQKSKLKAWLNAFNLPYPTGLT